jgi:hypothetical protein
LAHGVGESGKSIRLQKRTADMDYWFYIGVFVMQLALLASMAFCFYGLTILYLNNTLRKTKCSPGSLFASAVLIQVVLFPLIFCGIGVLAMAAPFGFVLPFAGLIGWAILGVKRRTAANVRCRKCSAR